MSGVEIGMGVVAVGGLATSIYSEISGAAAKSEAAQKNAMIKGMQADELMYRQAYNEQLMREQSERAQLDPGADLAASGREGGGIGAMLEIKKVTDENIAASRRESEFKAKMLRMGADVDAQLSSDLIAAGYVGAAGSLLSGAAQAYNLYKGPSKSPSLPNPKG